MKVLRVHKDDNVLVALEDMASGTRIDHEDSSFELREDVSIKHKFVTASLEPGDPIIMYGVLVGRATQSISQGSAISRSNIKHDSESFGARRKQVDWKAPEVSTFQDRKFQGYHRSDGQVGTRNHWLVVPLVFCENRNVLILKEAFEKNLGYSKADPYSGLVSGLVDQFRNNDSMSVDLTPPSKTGSSGNRVFPNLDGVKFLTHDGGCGGTRQDAKILCGLIAGYINHPNVAGATVLSLGCQNAQIDLLQSELADRNSKFDKPLLIFEQQKSQSEWDMMSTAIKQTFGELKSADLLERQDASLSNLVFGMECGGSDGFSGISANPSLGSAADLLVSLGGTVLLSEFPELCGVEQELIDRCVSDELADKFSSIMKSYSDRAIAVGSGFDMNPSPGNIKDGLITDAIKSAGAAKKGGTSPVTSVLDYPEYTHTKGLNLLCTPGNDVESTTGLAGSGANLIFFTTGLGTPTGNPITPTIKVSTNSELANRLPDIIDYDTGGIVEERLSIEQAGEELLELAMEVASGKRYTKAEIPMFSLEGKIAIVTGGASGIGKAISQVFAKQGADLVLLDVNQEAGEAAAEEIRNNGGTVQVVQCDISNQTKTISVIDAIQADKGRIDVMVNNAGISAIGNIEATSEEDMDRIYQVNIKGVYNGCKAVAVPPTWPSQIDLLME